MGKPKFAKSTIVVLLFVFLAIFVSCSFVATYKIYATNPLTGLWPPLLIAFFVVAACFLALNYALKRLERYDGPDR